MTDITPTRHVMASDLAYETADALDAITSLIAFSSRDWGMNKGDAWLYGIVLGWDDSETDTDTGSAMIELSRAHNWSDKDVARLRRLHTDWESIEPLLTHLQATVMAAKQILDLEEGSPELQGEHNEWADVARIVVLQHLLNPTTESTES